ncbi:phage head completion protein [Bosea minatitlanensis]|uniref:Head-tail adaptor protein n=1 Tax=Bosea minatitlanensis TaxID=128782 RepID=A0ABW0F280_9HYPH|nr:hypothetical protein [Bosea minatitlanensis]MCT4492716.1 hypothetical protein [Bosea minatitlanensis]
MSRNGRRSCLIQFYEGADTPDESGFPGGGTLWKTIWGDIVAERGSETTMADQRTIENYGWASVDYLELCEGAPPALIGTQRLGAMRLVHEGRSYDVDSIKADHVTKRDVVLRLVERASGT